MTPAASFPALESREIGVDWEEFSSLHKTEKQAFHDFCAGLEKAGWFSYPERPGNVWAFIGLDDYNSYAEYVKASKRAGASFYEGRKAEKRGYYTQFFNNRTFIEDIVAINTSASMRQGRPMTAGYRRSVEEMGGYPNRIFAPNVPSQRVFWGRHFGTFRACPGHRQGELQVDEQLLSYMIVRRLGDAAIYGTILGHNDYLREGVVYKMHLDFVKLVLNANVQVPADDTVDVSLRGLRYIFYAGFFGTEGLMRWKKNNLFRPGLFSIDLSRASFT